MHVKAKTWSRDIESKSAVRCIGVTAVARSVLGDVLLAKCAGCGTHSVVVFPTVCTVQQFHFLARVPNWQIFWWLFGRSFLHDVVC